MKRIFLLISVFFLIFQNNSFAGASFETSFNITHSSTGSSSGLADKSFQAYQGITFNPFENKMFIVHSKTSDSSDRSQNANVSISKLF